MPTLTIEQVYEKWKYLDSWLGDKEWLDEYHHDIDRAVYDCWLAIRAHVEARCVWTRSATGVGWDTTCGDWFLHDPRGDWCQFCGRKIEVRDAEDHR